MFWIQWEHKVEKNRCNVGISILKGTVDVNLGQPRAKPCSSQSIQDERFADSRVSHQPEGQHGAAIAPNPLVNLSNPMLNNSLTRRRDPSGHHWNRGSAPAREVDINLNRPFGADSSTDIERIAGHFRCSSSHRKYDARPVAT